MKLLKFILSQFDMPFEWETKQYVPKCRISQKLFKDVAFSRSEDKWQRVATCSEVK